MGAVADGFEGVSLALGRPGYEMPPTAADITRNASTGRNMFVLPIVRQWCSIRREPVKKHCNVVSCTFVCASGAAPFAIWMWFGAGTPASVT